MNKMIYLAMSIGLMSSAVGYGVQRAPDEDFEQEVLRPLDDIVKKIAQAHIELATDAIKTHAYMGTSREGHATIRTGFLNELTDDVALSYLMEKHPREFALGNIAGFQYDNAKASNGIAVSEIIAKERLTNLDRELTPENVALAAALNLDLLKSVNLKITSVQANQIQRAFNVLYSSYAEKHPDKIVQKGDREFINQQRTAAGFELFKDDLKEVKDDDLVFGVLGTNRYMNAFNCRGALQRLPERELLPEEEVNEAKRVAGDFIWRNKSGSRASSESLRPLFSPLEVEEQPSMFQGVVNSVKEWFAQKREAAKKIDWQKNLESVRQSVQKAAQSTSASVQKTAERIAEPSPEALESFGSTIEGEGSGRIQRYEIVPGSPADKIRQWWNKKE